MPDPVTAGISAVTSIGSGFIQGGAAKKAGRVQANAINAGIAEQRSSYDTIRQLLSPYASAGTPALQGLMNLAGLGQQGNVNWDAYVQGNPDALANWESLSPEQRAQFGSLQQFGKYHYEKDGSRRDLSAFTTGAVDGATAQQQAVSQLEQSPMFQTMARQGEDAIAQNASATGGLRGGNTQGALARFRPQLLDQFIERQYGRLAGIAQAGQNAAGATANAAGAMGGNIADLLVGRGQAQAGAIGAQGQIWSNTLGQIGGMASNAFAGGGKVPF